MHTLVLSRNALEYIDADALGRLELLKILHLDNNKLESIPLSLPSSLVELYLQNNDINELHPATLEPLTSLKMLDLSNNNIVYLPGLPLPNLETLAARNCLLENVNQLLVKMSPHLKVVYLENNPIKCADMLGIAEWATPCRNSGLLDNFNTPNSTSREIDEITQNTECLCINRRLRKIGEKRINCHRQPISRPKEALFETITFQPRVPVADNSKKIHLNKKRINKSKTNKQFSNFLRKPKEKELELQKKQEGLSHKHKFEEHFNDHEQLNNFTLNVSSWAEKLTQNPKESPPHPGLICVIGIAIGLLVFTGFIEFYKKCRSTKRQHRFEINNYEAAQSRQPDRQINFLQMDQLTRTNTNYQSPIELW